MIRATIVMLIAIALGVFVFYDNVYVPKANNGEPNYSVGGWWRGPLAVMFGIAGLGVIIRSRFRQKRQSKVPEIPLLEKLF